MFHRRMVTLTAAVCLLVGGLAACAESPAQDTDAPATGDASSVIAPVAATELPTAEAVEMATTVMTDTERVADANGCRPASQEVLDSLTEELAASGATIGASASQLLDVDEMIYGTWEVNAVDVTTKDGTAETGLWVTKVLPPGQWSSSAAKDSLGYSLNEVAAEVSSFSMATEQVFGRELTADDPIAVAVMACLP